jgi:hypothetical protein
VPAPADEKVPPFEEFKAPWEVDSDGNEIPEEDQEVDRGVLKKLLWNLRRDKARAVQARQAVETERDEFKEKVEEKAREGESEVDRLKRENEELKAKQKDAGKPDIKTLRLEAALEAGLPRAHIKRLDPDLTELDDLIEDAKALKASFGGSAGTETDDDDDDADTPRGRPSRTRTSGDPRGSRRSNEISIDDMLDKVPSSSGFRI